MGSYFVCLECKYNQKPKGYNLKAGYPMRMGKAMKHLSRKLGGEALCANLATGGAI